MRPHRINFVGGVYHVVTRCNNREFFFQDEADFLDFLKILLRAKKMYQVEIYAYCITSNHVHLLVGTPRKATLSRFMQYVNGNFARSYNRRHGKTGHFWGGRFHSTVIESETQFFNCLLYIEANMVRCGAVKCPADWRWSSFRAHALGEYDEVLDFHDLYLQLGLTPQERQEVYRAMTADRMAEKGLIRQPLFSQGVILGSHSFVQNLLTSLAPKLSSYRSRQAHETCFPDVFSLLRC